MHLRIATRKSELALWQARFVAEQLNALPAIDEVTLVPMSTRGDEVLDKSLQKIGGKGLFIKELEVAMQANVADIAVHSMKDVPAEMPEGFCIAAVLQRANPCDALLANGGHSLAKLKRSAVVGSSSLRRQAQLKALRPDLEIRPLRGNVNTRLKKLQDGDYDAIVLASAGLERLELDAHISEEFTPLQMLPAAAQGVVGIECLSEREGLRALLLDLEHSGTKQTTTAERAVTRYLQASCQSPLGSYAVVNDDELRLDALVTNPDGTRILRQQLSGPAEEAARIGEELAHELLQMGAADLLAEASQ